ncbi:MAG: SPASM domain-containing protein [Nitrospirota bacterium]|nr:SPASM domain-containing protein [Nitrospirota bacterium]
MEWDFFQKIIPQLDGIESISLFSSGEPLIAKIWDKVIRYFFNNLISDQWLGFSTNGMFLTEDKIKPLIGRNVSIGVSIDGSSRSTFERIRCGSHFDTLLKNMNLLSTLKKQNNTDKPYVNISFVAWKENIAELPDIVTMASKYGVKQIYVIHRIFYNKEDFQRFSLCNHRELLNNYLKKALELAHKLKIELIHTGDFSGEIPPPQGLKEMYFERRGPKILSCKIVDEQVTIGYKGLVRACCFIDKLFMGNLNLDSLAEIWNGPNYRRLRLNLYKGITSNGCEHCSFEQILRVDEKSCYCPLNTDNYIPASPFIKQKYNIKTLNEEFQEITFQWKRNNMSTDVAIKKLLALWDFDNNLFEIANNISVLYACKREMSHANFWMRKAKEIIDFDSVIENNYQILNPE